ncbi:aspartic peptidase A1 family [Artemisia annua]|uniref:Aspartic peptidase A1 family n=1 Tax=Artemisia annua TaxID=35608 RepID=A0A2U1NSH0_ARTAN|nr:aspartic peptidase A1 family [Artemisia annua]
MKMHLLLRLSVIVLAFVTHQHEAIAQYVPPYTSIVVPVNKHTDAAKDLYSVQIMTTYVNMQYLHAKFLIDLDAPFIWHDCILQWNIFPGSCPNNTYCTSPVSCEEFQCTDVRTSYSYENSASCPPVTNSSTLPGWGFCTCPVNVINPINGSCGDAQLSYDQFTVNTSDGKNVFTGLYGAYPNAAACAPSSSFKSFPANVTGVMAFSTSPYALPALLFQPLKKIIALCLPSTSSAPGVLFFGTGPYYLLPNSDVDVRSLLSYTSLLKHPDSFGYYIGVTSIVIKQKSIGIPVNSTTKLSTLEPYTTLRNDFKYLRCTCKKYTFISHQHEAISQYVPYAHTSLVAPIRKHIDAAKPLYSVQTILSVGDKLHENLLIDIDAPLTYHACIFTKRIADRDHYCRIEKICRSPLPCNEDPCRDLQNIYTYHNPSCPSITNIPSPPDIGTCTCPVNVLDPVTGLCGLAYANHDAFILHTSKGRQFFKEVFYFFQYASCASSTSFKSFPANVTGVMALSAARYALPTSRGYLVSITQIIAICLPSRLSVRGVLFLGNGPYFFNPQSDIDVTSYLSYTPLLKQPDSFGYFIRVNAIFIKNRSITVPANITTKLSTTDPYTTLRTDIYNSVVKRFSKVTKKIPPAKAIAPFSLCFKTSKYNGTVSLKVPGIDLSLQDGKNWTISTTNSIKQITKNVACLAFIDGGATSEPAIMIGTFQFEDNLVVFDNVNSRFGISSSLLRKQTSCSHFNFTLTDNTYSK